MTTRKIQKILCPVDFSETSASALRYARALASCWNADIVVLHAYPAQRRRHFTEARIEHLSPRGSDTQTVAKKALEEKGDEWFKIQEDRTKLMKKYYKKVEKQVSLRAAVSWMQVEHRLSLLIDLQIAAAVPIVEPIKK